MYRVERQEHATKTEMVTIHNVVYCTKDGLRRGSIGILAVGPPCRPDARTLRDSVRVYSISASALIRTLVASIPRKGGSARGTFTLWSTSSSLNCA